MGEKRKLQAEIERCMKKVTEGVDLFNEIWEKFQNAGNANQKEKFEADLKKEIKKLQRLRDMIKGWMSSSEVKDKDMLSDRRRLIEQQMERFKAVERETKTKAFSKTGLTAEQKMDPKEREREELRNWLSDCIDRIGQQNDQFEAEIEVIESNSGKKKKLDKEKQEKVDTFRLHLERHKFHIKRLEMILRLVDNNGVDTSLVKDLKDDVEYYMDSCLETDFGENMQMYDDLGLDFDELEARLGAVTNVGGGSIDDEEEEGTLSTTSPAPSPGPSSLTRESTSSKEMEDRGRHVSGGDTMQQIVLKPVANRAASVNIAGSRSTPNTPFKQQTSFDVTMPTEGARPPLIPTPPPPPPPFVGGLSYNSVVASGSTRATTTPKPAAVAQPSQAPTQFKTDSVPESFSSPPAATPTKLTTAPSPTRSASTPPVGAPVVVLPQPPLTPNVSQPPPALAERPVQARSVSPPATTTAFNIPLPSPKTQVTPLVSTAPLPTPTSTAVTTVTQMMQQQSINGPASVEQNKDSVVGSLRLLAQQAAASQPAQALLSLGQTPAGFPLSTATHAPPAQLAGYPPPGQPPFVTPIQQQQLAAGAVSSFFGSLMQPPAGSVRGALPQEANIPPYLGASPLGKVPLSQMELQQYGYLDAMMARMPMPMDSERARHYLPRAPVQIPPYYPQNPPPVDHAELFSRLSPDVLFFIFYYMEGTKAQVLAAQALKKQSWRFHTKHKMWFQRHEEPKRITEEFEQGTYIYFDYEQWKQGRKEDFRFEYKYLEDREL